MSRDTSLSPCRVTPRPSLRSNSSYGPCGPPPTRASRPSTPSRGGRGEGRALAWGAPCRSAQMVANAGVSSVEGIEQQAAGHCTAAVRLSLSRRAHLDARSCAPEASNWRRLYPLLFEETHNSTFPAHFQPISIDESPH